MDYEKKYKEALERAQKFEEKYGGGYAALIFPELAESEDERIRKKLIWQVKMNIEDETSDLNKSIYDGMKGHDPDLEESIEDWKKCLAWLKKQKEQKPIEIKIDNPNIEKVDPDVKITTNDSSANGDELLYVCNKSYKIGYRDGKRDAEQKPVKYLDKDKVYAIMNKLTELSTSDLIPIESEEYVKIHEITSDVCSLLNYPIEQKSAEWSEEDD